MASSVWFDSNSTENLYFLSKKNTHFHELYKIWILDYEITRHNFYKLD